MEKNRKKLKRVNISLNRNNGTVDGGLYQQKSEKGAAGGYASLDGNAKVPQIQLPAIAITNTFVVNSEAAMLALAAATGDVCIRTDLNKSFILQGTDPSLLTDWQELLSPTSTVLSVNGQVGAVSLTKADIGLGNVPNVDATNPANINQNSAHRFVTDAQIASWNGFASPVIDCWNGAVNTTSSTTEQILRTILIPAGTLLPNDALSMQFLFGNTFTPSSGSTTAIYRVRIGTTLSPVNIDSETLLGTFSFAYSLSVGSYVIDFQRILGITASGVRLPTASGGFVGSGAATGVYVQTIAIDWSVDQYLYITGAQSSNGHTRRIFSSVVQRIRG